MDKMIRASGRMQILIDDILMLSRLSKTDTPHSDVDLGELIHQIVDDLEMAIKEKQAEILIGKLPVVRGVSGQMHQLFQNLISNAVKFNDAKPVIHVNPINVSADFEQEFGIAAKDYYGVCVEDNGIGFDEQYGDKIFGIFQRLDKHNYPGTGIGLAIVKKIVDNHGGFIKAKSQRGKGAKFIVLLPKKSKPMANAEVNDIHSAMSNN
jgi:signal transduction histidine kinase